MERTRAIRRGARLLVAGLLVFSVPAVWAAQSDGTGNAALQDHEVQTGQPGVVEDVGEPETTPDEGYSRKGDQPPAGTAQQIVYLDLSTGELISGEAAENLGLVLGPELTEAVKDSSDGLVQERSSEPGGGWSVDLKGRFRHVMVATVQSDGAIGYSHDVLALTSPDAGETSGSQAEAEQEAVCAAEPETGGPGGAR